MSGTSVSVYCKDCAPIEKVFSLRGAVSSIVGPKP